MTDTPDTPDPQPVDQPVDDAESFEAWVNEETQRLTRAIFAYATQVMTSGSARTKNDFIRQVYPSLVRNLRTEEVNDELEAIKAAQQRIFSQLASGDPGELPPRPAVPDILPDSPSPRP